jgi:hypothetical protein
VAIVGIAFVATASACASAQGPRRLGASEAAFPAGWAGVWEGTLTTWGAPDSVRNRIPLSLTIAREDTGSAYTWRTVFNADTVRGVRPYRLIVRDGGRGAYGTDEGNGLVLEEQWIGGSLISVFQVGERVLDIVWWSARPVSSMMGEGPIAERGAAVLSFRVEGRQQALMTRRR